MSRADALELDAARPLERARAGRTRALSLPRPARVTCSPKGSPLEVNGERVDSMRESWLVEDRWWTERPLRRRYWELVSARGRNLVVFHDLCGGGWFTQGGGERLGRLGGPRSDRLVQKG